MDFETFLIIVFAVMFVICSLVLRFGWKFTYIKGKYQRGRYIRPKN